MYNASTIEKLYGIVGLNQPFDPVYAILDTNNTTSRSGFKADSNSLVSVSKIKECQNYINISDLQFNELIKNKQIDAINNVLQNVFNESSFRQRNKVYESPLNKVNTNMLENGFVCNHIKVNKKNNIAFTINRVILDFVGTGDITLQLYSSQQLEPLFSRTITITSTTQIEELNWVVNNSEDAGKGDYLLGYITNPVLNPYARDYERSNITTCYRDLYIRHEQYLGHTSNNIPDLRNASGISEYTGVNADISVHNDYTDLILREENLFAKCIDIQFQIELLKLYMGSLRTNRTQRTSEDEYTKLMLELKGSNQDVVFKQKGIESILIGEITTLRKKIKAIREGFSGGMLMRRTVV